MNAKLNILFAAIFVLFIDTASSINVEGSGCSNDEGCDSQTSSTGTVSSQSLDWYINVGLARYPKPTVFSNFSQTAFELDGNLPTFKDIYSRYFSSDPLQQKQIKLRINQPKISAATFHPSVLFLQSEANFTTLKKPAASGFPEYIHQILTDDAFTHIEILPAPASGWRLRVWKRDVAPLTLSGGFYVITGFNAVTPLTDVTFARPTGSTSNDTLRYTQKETTGVSGTRTTNQEIVQVLDSNGRPVSVTSKIFTGESTTGPVLSQQKLSYIERGTKIWDYTIIRETLTSSLSASGVVGGLVLTAKTREDYDDYSTNSVGGALGMKRLVSHTEAFAVTGQTPQTTTYTYIQAPTNPTVHGRLESSVNPDGSWNFMEYAINPTSPVAITTSYSGWKDLTMTQRANARKTVLQVSANEALTEESIGGTLVSKSKITLGAIGGDPVTTSEAWDGNAWHINTTAYFPDTAAAPSTGRIKWIENSDGTATTYSYATVSGSLVVTQRSGAGNRNGITAGTEVKTTHNLGNFAIAEITKDMASGLNIQQWDTDVSYNNGFDKLGRPIKRIYNADVDDYDISQHACCGLEFSRDRMGATTQYFRDGLKRVYKVETKASTASPVVTSYTSVNGLSSTQTRTYGASASQFLGSTAQSIDGLTTTVTSPAQNSTNSADRVTTTRTIMRNAATGDTIITTNNFDATTETISYYLSGQMKSSVRTGYTATTFDYAPLEESNTSGNLTSSQTIDLLGRPLASSSPSSGTTTTTYHPLNASAGARAKVATITNADGLTIRYGYNAKGEQTTVSRPIPMPNGAIATQVTSTENEFIGNVNLHGTDLGVSLRSTQSVASSVTTMPSQGAIPPIPIDPITTTIHYRSIRGLLTGSVSFNRQTLNVLARPNPTTGIATKTIVAPDGTKIKQSYTHGLLTLSQQLNSLNTVISSVAATYNALQQQITSTDSRTGTTNFSNFTEVGQSLTTTNPAGEVTTTTLDRHGRPTAVQLPDNSFTYTSYHPNGQVAAKWGRLTNPTFTLYDDQGRVQELRTFANLTTEPTATTTGFAQTTWQYSATTGLLLSKKDHLLKGASYSYTAAGLLATRTWARSTSTAPKTTQYQYNQGLLTSINYSDTTPDVTITYDLLGRKNTLQSAVSRTEFVYHSDTLDLDKEIITHTLPGQASFTRTIDRSKDALHRATGYQVLNGNNAFELGARYDYNATFGRLAKVFRLSSATTTAEEFGYGYTAQSNLIASVAGPAHTVTNSFEANRDVLLTKLNQRANDHAVISSISYTVNNIGQRTTATRSGSATNSTAWGYDALGQVTSADDSNNNADRAYLYDTIGNRKKSANSLTLPTSENYIVNDLNQYTNIGGFLPSYDDDGNQINAQIQPQASATIINAVYEWDGENRLRCVKNSAGAILVEYHYDAQSRRVATSASGNTILFLYDGWNVIAEYQFGNATFNLHTSYLWGLDLSGSMQGAGGVGGLLAVTEIPASSAPVTYYPLFDGNGNITEYIDGAGSVVAQYQYDPFGNTTLTSGTKADDFAYRFSTKPLDSATGLYYYGYRYYDPVTGRWPSRDPIEEAGGINLYGFVGNDGLNSWDFLGFITHDEYLNELIKNLKNNIHKEWIRDQLKRGCVGVVCVNLGSEPSNNFCYDSYEKAVDKQKKLNKGSCCPQIYSLKLVNDTGIEKDKPDVTFDRKGKANLRNWNKSSKDKDSPNFDYAFMSPVDGRMWGADLQHNPDLLDKDGKPGKDGKGENYPLNPVHEMNVIVSTKNEWEKKSKTFDVILWCVQCKGGRAGGK
jgi:RHS repeat-associated protein